MTGVSAFADGGHSRRATQFPDPWPRAGRAQW